MHSHIIRIRVFDQQGKRLEDRVFMRFSLAISFAKEQVLLFRELRITREPNMVLGWTGKLRNTVGARN